MLFPSPESRVPTAVLWFPVAAVALHVFEEFVWPGGFAAWYRRYPPGATVIVTPQFLFLMNAVFAGLALLPPLLGSTPRALGIWIMVAAIAAANAVFHINATVRTRAYSPGVATAAVLYLPLGLIGGVWLIRDGLVAPGGLVQAMVIAIAYQAWSTWKHRRHAVTRGGS
jgi:hypothetical protein